MAADTSGRGFHPLSHDWTRQTLGRGPAHGPGRCANLATSARRLREPGSSLIYAVCELRERQPKRLSSAGPRPPVVNLPLSPRFWGWWWAP